MPESSNSLFPSAQPVPLLVMAQQDMCDGQADQLGVGYVQGLAWTGPGEPARGDDAVGQFHIECDYLEPESGCPRCKRRSVLCAFCWVLDTLPGQCLHRRPRANPLSLMLFELSGYYVNTVQLHVHAADVLVRRGIDRDGSR